MKENRPFDIAILDLIIIDSTEGGTIIRTLKQITPDIKTIASGDLLNDRIISDYKSYGFCAILIKPYGLDDLKKVLDQVINQN
jgi:DNA-binding NarL/FixJ family response regulator